MWTFFGQAERYLTRKSALFYHRGVLPGWHPLASGFLMHCKSIGIMEKTKKKENWLKFL